MMSSGVAPSRPPSHTRPMLRAAKECVAAARRTSAALERMEVSHCVARDRWRERKRRRMGCGF